jgi:hypothetical protein
MVDKTKTTASETCKSLYNAGWRKHFDTIILLYLNYELLIFSSSELYRIVLFK